MPRRLLLAAAAIGLALATRHAAAQDRTLVVFFPEWSAALDDAANAVITHAAGLAKQSTPAAITVIGYADLKGSIAANIDISQLRAQRVIDAMLADGVPNSQMTLDAHGAQKTGGQVNRRVEIIIAAP